MYINGEMKSILMYMELAMTRVRNCAFVRIDFILPSIHNVQSSIRLKKTVVLSLIQRRLLIRWNRFRNKKESLLKISKTTFFRFLSIMQLEFGENSNGFVILGKFSIQRSYQKFLSTKGKIR